VDGEEQQLGDGSKARDETIRRLNAMLAGQMQQAADDSPVDPAGDETETLRGVIADVNRKLTQEAARRERLEQRLGTTSAALQKTEAALRPAEAQRNALARDLELVEDNLTGLLRPTGASGEDMRELDGRTILYVGGRAHQIPQLKALVEQMGARFLHHDGGIEHSATLLPGLIGRAGYVLFPVACISHDDGATAQ